MYKITNKSTGFIQYRDIKGLTTFMYYNDESKYKVEQIENFDIMEFLAKIVFVIMMLGLVFLSFWYGLS